jgi:hypothetical protein
VLLNDVKIVEQPVAGRTDVETALGAGVQLMIDAVENVSRVLKAKQQWPRATLFLRWKQVVPARDRSRALAESLSTQHLTTDGTDEFFAGTVSGTAE